MEIKDHDGTEAREKPANAGMPCTAQSASHGDLEMLAPALERLAPNFTKMTVGDLTTWFSYDTMVAFRKGGVTYVRKNEWGNTTGKHLNAIDGGKASLRVDLQTFERELGRLTKEME